MADDYIVQQLAEKEKIEFEHEVNGISWLATNKRVIKFVRDIFGRKSFSDLSYKHIVSVNLEEKRRMWVIVIALILFFYGISAYSSGAIISSLVLGLVFFRWKNSYYQFNAPSINLLEWKVNDTVSEEADKFIRIVRKHCFSK